MRFSIAEIISRQYQIKWPDEGIIVTDVVSGAFSYTVSLKKKEKEARLDE